MPSKSSRPRTEPRTRMGVIPANETLVSGFTRAAFCMTIEYFSTTNHVSFICVTARYDAGSKEAMRKILACTIFILLPGIAASDIHRCVIVKLDKDRLACFDAEMKIIAPSFIVAPVSSRPVARSPNTSASGCYTGPRGGRYRMVNGHKRYDC